jgi:hypothetical protein
MLDDGDGEEDSDEEILELTLFDGLELIDDAPAIT